MDIPNLGLGVEKQYSPYSSLRIVNATRRIHFWRTYPRARHSSWPRKKAGGLKRIKILQPSFTGTNRSWISMPSARRTNDPWRNQFTHTIKLEWTITETVRDRVAEKPVVRKLSVFNELNYSIGAPHFVIWHRLWLSPCFEINLSIKQSVKVQYKRQAKATSYARREPIAVRNFKSLPDAASRR